MTDARGRNEGAIDLSYKPPKSMKKLTSVDDEAVEAGLEWDALSANPDVDVWAVRIPAGLKPADLAGLKIKLPSSSSVGITGTFKTGDCSYRLQGIDGEDVLGGEEMENLSCLVPKKGDGGALYTIPRPLKRLILTREDPVPTPPLSAPPSQPIRRPQPLDRLKHAFAPIGSQPISPPSSMMEVDDQPMENESPKKKQKKISSIKVEASESKKSKSKGKSKDKEPQAANEAMDLDEVAEPSQTKKPKKKPSRPDIKTDGTEPTPGVKKEKKKRKAAGGV
ncbi:hypothetical protein RSOLAG1IB_07177 [Rhizoctonia solani AG-1 IB]|uniref:Uncharacterized protein n=1 Tax=Thanatephorus cucumeris (strain AG1-IB / isolate 7/3/14) TaxID=1108050 RepID=A0A0B7FEI6_THACB|nr:hypothetical protein RSOLAG1IB_07177 [Rhizoctonia solani AG-1 IB]